MIVLFLSNNFIERILIQFEYKVHTLGLSHTFAEHSNLHVYTYTLLIPSCDHTKHGCDCLIPTKYTNDPALGRWVSTQREHYRLYKAGDKKSKMTTKKIELLQTMGFIWRLQF